MDIQWGQASHMPFSEKPVGRISISAALTDEQPYKMGE